MGGCLDGSITAAYDKRHRLGKKNGVCLSEPAIVHPESSVCILRTGGTYTLNGLHG